MENNFALRYVFTYPGIISHAELVPVHGASRRQLGIRKLDNFNLQWVLSFFIFIFIMDFLCSADKDVK
jgi:hypothetical protein